MRSRSLTTRANLINSYKIDDKAYPVRSLLAQAASIIKIMRASTFSNLTQMVAVGVFEILRNLGEVD
jgi:hypothetical protein